MNGKSNTHGIITTARECRIRDSQLSDSALIRFSRLHSTALIHLPL